MTVEEALEFLQNNQPLPNDADLDESTIKKYAQVREYFLNTPDVRCVPLFLNTFGEGSGYGVYQLIEDVIIQYSKEEVLPHLILSLQSDHKGVRYWCSQIASSFPDTELIRPLVRLLDEPDSDIRYSAIMALAQIDDVGILSIIKDKRLTETDPEVLELLDEIMEELQ